MRAKAWLLNQARSLDALVHDAVKLEVWRLNLSDMVWDIVCVESKDIQSIATEVLS